MALGLSKDLGTIEVGKRADLLLLRAHPLQSVAACDAVDRLSSQRLLGLGATPADL